VSLKYVHDADRLRIHAPSAPKSGDVRQFTVKYRGIAATGLHILKNKFGERCFFSVNCLLWDGSGCDDRPSTIKRPASSDHRASKYQVGGQRPAAGSGGPR